MLSSSFVVFPSNVSIDADAAATHDVHFLPLVLFCTLLGQRGDLICFKPTYFWKYACVFVQSL